ncbi:hypothetical protein VNO77_43345 [Canavalia gladiata]|uniref:Uncharacterized protein n=1 Tax=Canavalia gladiata TaxID=3824 RepID=A0AAN9JXK4_CANGL
MLFTLQLINLEFSELIHFYHVLSVLELTSALGAASYIDEILLSLIKGMNHMIIEMVVRWLCRIGVGSGKFEIRLKVVLPSKSPRPLPKGFSLTWKDEPAPSNILIGAIKEESLSAVDVSRHDRSCNEPAQRSSLQLLPYCTLPYSLAAKQEQIKNV